jgi:hypothetical protein
MSLPLL